MEENLNALDSILTFIYLIASVTFIIGLKMLSHPESARKGNLIAAGGMTLAVFGTIFLYQNPLNSFERVRLQNLPLIFTALVVGSIVGVMSARKVKMTAMPEMVSLFNGMGGACAALISILEFNHLSKSHFTEGFLIEDDFSVIGQGDLPVAYGKLAVIFVGLIIGAVSFAGSMIAWGKLNGKVKDYSFRGQHIVNLALLAALIGISVTLLSTISSSFTYDHGALTNTANKVVLKGPLNLVRINTSVYVLFYALLLLSLAYGVLFVLPIGGADMPVVISLLNSFTGVAAACGGFLYDNKVMLTGGILVGAAGTLLTILMCRAMNRSLKNVLIGSFGGGSTAAVGGVSKDQGHFREINLSDAAVVLAYANKVMIVPGYGLAVAQAQHACHELEKLLNDKGVEVKYAIHPVAGRMPGHMNVLLAEADVSYEKLQEMEQANEEFPTTDVVLVLGANDVVNPAAKRDPASPIYGMPILDVESAKSVIVNKRSMKPGYAGIENDLFFEPRTSMLFGDAKKVLQDLIGEIKNL
ncbi:MAG: NAD(P)(+) transhydrogenase (Re/Si-specific) subunit beta [Chitinophagaceae bacterium]|nr:MAG: NAD(P)(+) transhydrogenase (Re/Si-specific) subunit beta [Chitinophagaceae bacterium]